MCLYFSSAAYIWWQHDRGCIISGMAVILCLGPVTASGILLMCRRLKRRGRPPFYPHGVPCVRNTAFQCYSCHSLPRSHCRWSPTHPTAIGWLGTRSATCCYSQMMRWMSCYSAWMTGSCLMGTQHDHEHIHVYCCLFSSHVYCCLFGSDVYCCLFSLMMACCLLHGHGS